MPIVLRDIDVILEDGTVEFPFQNGEFIAWICGNRLRARDLIARCPWLVTHPLVVAAGGLGITHLDNIQGPFTQVQMVGKHNYRNLENKIKVNIFSLDYGNAHTRVVARQAYIRDHLVRVIREGRGRYIPRVIRETVTNANRIVRGFLGRRLAHRVRSARASRLYAVLRPTLANLIARLAMNNNIIIIADAAQQGGGGHRVIGMVVVEEEEEEVEARM